MRLSVIVPSLTGEMPKGLVEDPRLEIVIVKGVSPVGKARNEGLRRATGDYIAWVDSDDEVTDGWLDEICRALETRPDMLMLGYEWVVGSLVIRKIWTGSDVVADILTQNWFYSELWNKVMHRSLWEGVRFDATARTLEDWDVMPRLLARAKSVVALPKVLYRYRWREGSLTQQRDPDWLQEELDRSFARISLAKELGLWRRYRRETLSGVACSVYSAVGPLGRGDPIRRRGLRWIWRHLPALLCGPAKYTYKARWTLELIGLGGLVRRWRGA